MSDPITQAAIQVRAYRLWEESGRVDGNHEEHWRRAEAECGAGSGDRASVADGVGGPTTFPGTDGDGDGPTIAAGRDGAVPPVPGADGAASSGEGGDVPASRGGARSKPRRWPTPIVDA